jgi:dUTP pyrophosphatase
MTQPDPEPIDVPILRLPGQEDLPLPAYQSEHAAGMDLHAAVPADAPVPIAPGQIVAIPCGFQIAVPVGYEAQVRPRSGLALKHGISMPNTPGTIDADYRGQVQVLLVNLGSETFTVTRGMRIAQMLIKPVPRVRLREVKELPPTQRGAGGFGHTGH